MTDNHDTMHQLILSKVEDLHDDVKEIKVAVKKQNGRVRQLEDWRNYLLGAGALGSVVAGVLWKLL